MEPTTTEGTPTDGAAAVAQPVDGAQPTAAQPQEPQSQGQPAQANDEYAAWLQSKGLESDGSEAFNKAAQMAYNAEKLMTKATQEASQLRKSLTPNEPLQPQDNYQGDPMLQEFVQDYRRDKLINGFKESHPDWAQHEPAMVDLLGQVTPSGYSYRDLVNANVIGLDTVYAMAKASAPGNTEQVKQQAQQEVLQTLANTQRAGGGNAHASNSNPQAPINDPVLEGIKRNRAQ